MPRPTAKDALRRAQEKPGRTEKVADNLTDSPQPEPEPSTVPALTQTHRVSAPRLPNAATSQRSNKPANYKLHVLTALGLAFMIRVAAFGGKAFTG